MNKRIVEVFFASVLAGFIVNSPAQTQFTHIFPDYPTDPIVDLMFQDSLVGFFTNEAGSVYRTLDGGLSWHRVAHYQGDPVSRIRFLDRDLGFGASPYAGLRLDKVNSIHTGSGGLWWSEADVNLSDAGDFMPLSPSVILKSTMSGIQRLDNFYGAWQETWRMPIYWSGGDLGMPYGTVKEFVQRPGGPVLALASFENASRDSVIRDSVSLILRSIDEGTSWDTLWQGATVALHAVAFASDSVGWMGGEYQTIFRTTDGGRHWTLQNTDSLDFSRIITIACIDEQHAAAATETGIILRTTDGGSTWAPVIVDYVLAGHARLVFVNDRRGFYSCRQLYRTDDGGATWAPVDTKRINGGARQIQFLNRRLGWVLADSGLFASVDGGTSWTRRYSFQTEGLPAGIDMIDTLNGWAVNRVRRMKTTDGGYSWTSMDFPAPREMVRGIEFYDKNLGIVYEIWNRPASNQTSNMVTTDGGVTWSEYPITNSDFPPSWSKVEFTDPDHLWFENQQGLWLSRDSAKTWTISDTVSGMAFDMASNLLGVCDTWPMDRFGLTNDGGKSWSFFHKPYPNQTLDVAIVDPRSPSTPTTLLVGYDGTIFQLQEGYSIQTCDSYVSTPLRGIAVVREGNSAYVWVLGSGFDILATEYVVTGVANRPEEQMPRFALAQNYPNPFNPTTTIGYTLPRRSHVILAVYDLLGQKVAELVNGEIEPGYHDAQFDARGLASGVYFYRLTAGSSTETKRLMLLR